MDGIGVHDRAGAPLDLGKISPEPDERDVAAYQSIISTELTAEQAGRVATPAQVEARQEHVVAVHWHPEFVPHELIRRRIDAMFPSSRERLIIPTQHNELIEWDGYAGVEIDCYSTGFNRKVQLLAHFSAESAARADALRAMLQHTFKYRATQLNEFIDSVLDPAYDDRVSRAAIETGASPDLVRFVRLHVAKLKALIDRFHAVTPGDMLKNKLIRNFFHTLGDVYDQQLVKHAQVFLNAVKRIVKANFSPTYFYKTMEIIEEVRRLGGGIVIPHPEQFWPILLADYDIDGIEVWNPQSREYTEFLINVVHRENRAKRRDDRPLLIFMGDDTHFGEKVLDPAYQDPEKAGRELGVQPAWDDPAIRKSLCLAGVDRAGVIVEYRQRLA